MRWFRLSRGFPQKLSKTSFNFSCNCNVRSRSRRDCDLCLFSQACRDTNLRRSKIWRLSLLHFTPPPPPAPLGDVNALPPPTKCPSSHGPLYQNDVKCSAFDMEMVFNFRANKSHFHKKYTWLHFQSGLFLTWERLRILYEVLHEVYTIKSRFVKMTKYVQIVPETVHRIKKVRILRKMS